jgi:hypothetical protein
MEVFKKIKLEGGVRVSEQRVPKFLTYRCAKGEELCTSK